MNASGQIAHLLATDPIFRLAFLRNQDEAIAAQALTLDAEARAALANIHQLLVTSPQELTARMLAFANYPADWGGFSSEGVMPAPQPL